MSPITTNTLFYGDNLLILRDRIDSSSVDLIYLDPPFNSRRSYNILYKDEYNKESESQVIAFEDTWHWNDTAERTYYEIVTQIGGEVGTMIGAMRQFIGSNQMMAYLVMMTIRLAELHRVLKPTGCMYLHCDPTASHYLKIVLDSIFGPENFTNEISWRRTTTKGDYKQGATNWPRIRDVILHYHKDVQQKGIFHQPFAAYSEAYLSIKYRYKDTHGRVYRLDNVTAPGAGSRGHPQYEFLGVTRYWRYNKERMQELYEQGRIVQTKPGTVPQYKRYLDEVPGVAIGDSWDDIDPINSQAAERLGYATQKPLALLERIINASSNPGDLVLDPFCGCGTAVAAAQKLDRRWIGIDITHLAITLQKYRLEQMYPGITFKIIGEPTDVGSAKALAHSEPDGCYQFQWWALSLVQARPFGGEAGSKQGKKGSDKGIDGVIAFIDEASGKPKRAIVQVKSGKVSRRDIGELVGTVEREQAALGVFITLEDATRDMRTEAIQAGYYHSPGWNQNYPKIQLLTIGELLHGATVKMPPTHSTFKEAHRVEVDDAEQERLW